MAELQLACSLDELVPNQPLVVKVAGREVAVVRVGQDVFALRSICPHQSISFAGAQIRPRLTSSGPNSPIEVDHSDPLLFCPWHSWSFSLRDGRCPTDPGMRVRSYPVTIDEGHVYIALS